MPKTPIDYSRTVIYKIQHIEDDSLLYIGSTTDFTKRKTQHKTVCNNPNSNSYNQKKYDVIRSSGGWDAFTMIEIEKFPCRDSKEARRREDEIMREMKANMNTKRANRNKKEYYHDNKETIKEKKKQYYISNTEEILQRKKLYREKNQKTINRTLICECGCEVKQHLNRHRKSKKHIDLMSNQ
jgi:hypothetical protein